MKAIAPGKLILSGEHAVVYGRPALAMAIDRGAQAVVAPGTFTEGEVCFHLQDVHAEERFTIRALREFRRRAQANYEQFLRGEMGIREVLRKPIDLFEFAFITLLDGLHLKFQEPLDIRLKSTIPIGCGLGSSAASVLSVLRAIGHYFRVEFRPDWYYAYSLEAEKMQHGFPSGVDSFISLHGGCARFQQGQAEKIPLPKLPLTLVQTGVPAATTGECVTQVRQTHGASAIWDEFEAVTRGMEEAIRTQNLAALRQRIRDNHRLLQGLGVVPGRVADFIADIEKAGGAAKISGAGAVAGDAAGIVMVASERPPAELCRRYGYTCEPIRGEPLGVRVV